MKALSPLPYDAWRDTRETLHRWTQIVGKVRLEHAPLVNHWWNCALYVSPRGLTTSAIPYGDGWFEIELDFVDDVLRIRTATREEFVELRPQSVATFYATTMSALRRAGIDCRIWTTPVEIADPIPFEHDEQHASYDREAVVRFWRNLESVAEVLTKFRSGFIGKCSPVHFFWGSFDLAVTRFSGRRAPDFEADAITREAYSHEVSSAGWWPGDSRLERAAFYSYAAPEPAGFARSAISPARAYYFAPLKGFYLDHDDICRAADPEAVLLDFCNTTYASAADLGAWPRAELERPRAAGDTEVFHGHVQTPGGSRRQPSPNERM